MIREPDRGYTLIAELPHELGPIVVTQPFLVLGAAVELYPDGLAASWALGAAVAAAADIIVDNELGDHTEALWRCVPWGDADVLGV